MSFTLEWSIEGEKQLSRRLRNIGDSVKNWQPAFDKATKRLKDIFENDVFNTQGGAIGEAWSPLSRAYAAQKAKRYGNRGILEATGRMRNSFQRQFKPDYGKVWNSVNYFKYHQSNQPRQKLPRRVMMKLAEEQREIVVKIFQQVAIEKIKQS